MLFRSPKEEVRARAKPQANRRTSLVGRPKICLKERVDLESVGEKCTVIGNTTRLRLSAYAHSSKQLEAFPE